MKRLTQIQPGEEAELRLFEGGRRSEMRLMDMGLLPGTKIKMLMNTGMGPVMISVKGSKLSLGHGLAEKILVKEV